MHNGRRLWELWASKWRKKMSKKLRDFWETCVWRAMVPKDMDCTAVLWNWLMGSFFHNTCLSSMMLMFLLGELFFGDLLCNWHNSTLEDLRLERCWLTSARSLCPSPGIFFCHLQILVFPGPISAHQLWWVLRNDEGKAARAVFVFFSVKIFGGTGLR